MMDNSKFIKLLIKIGTPRREQPHWVHLCYVDRDLHNTYTAQIHHINNETLSKWCKEDFGTEMSIKTFGDLDKLRTMVKGYYSKKYPEVYSESPTDRQGWFRLWVQNKMKEELNGKVSV